MAGKRRPGVFVDALAVGCVVVGVAVPATATRGHQPGVLALTEPPAPGLRPSRLLTPYLCALPIDRFEPLDARLAPEKRGQLEALIAHWFGADWRKRDPTLRAPFKGARRLHPRSGAERRRERFGQKSGDAGAAAP